MNKYELMGKTYMLGQKVFWLNKNFTALGTIKSIEETTAWRFKGKLDEDHKYLSTKDEYKVGLQVEYKKEPNKDLTKIDELCYTNAKNLRTLSILDNKKKWGKVKGETCWDSIVEEAEKHNEFIWNQEGIFGINNTPREA